MTDYDDAQDAAGDATEQAGTKGRPTPPRDRSAGQGASDDELARALGADPARLAQWRANVDRSCIPEWARPKTLAEHQDAADRYWSGPSTPTADDDLDAARQAVLDAVDAASEHQTPDQRRAFAARVAELARSLTPRDAD